VASKVVGFLIMLFVSLAAKAAGPNPHDIHYRYSKDHVVVLDGNRLGACLRNELAKRPVTFAVADFYQGNPRRHGQGFVCQMSNANLYDYLLASSDGCDFQTGKEEALKKWILAQQDNSIDPVKIFSQALNMTNGKVFDAVLMIHQMLRNQARWWNTEAYDYSSTNEESSRFWNKFIDIRGSLSSRKDKPFEGDHEGSWYRIWGIMLYTLKQNDPKNCPTVLSRVGTNLKAQGQAIAAEMVKYLFDAIPSSGVRHGGDRRGKMLTNTAGATAAGWLTPDRGQLPWFSAKGCAERNYLQKSVFDY
jgi:hypothetical protein